ncbi:MAG: right-handed parallel beta-helix repeat-containing protein [Pseudomonadota bacterium]
MKMKFKSAIAGVGALFAATSSFGCDVTIGPGSSIQSALNTASSGDRVCLTNGTYNVTSTITVSNNKQLYGANGTASAVTIVGQSLPSSGSASRVIVLRNGSDVAHLIVEASGTIPEFGILAFQSPGSLIYDNQVTAGRIGIGVQSSNSARILTNTVFDTGDPSDGIPDGNIWIKLSSSVRLEWGSATGDGTFIPGPQGFLIGDGGVICDDSANLRVTGTNVYESGSAGYYLVDCPNATIRNVSLIDNNGWGVDAPFGDGGLLVENTLIRRSGRGGSVFGSNGAETAVFDSVTFDNNNFSGQANCNGVNVAGAPTSVVTTPGSTANPAGVLCAYP